MIETYTVFFSAPGSGPDADDHTLGPDDHTLGPGSLGPGPIPGGSSRPHRIPGPHPRW